MTINVLDNPVWHALVGPHRMHALGRGLARHYPRDMAPFSAIAEPSAAAYADLAAELPAGTEARLFRPQVEPLPDGWQEINRFSMLQMVATRQPEGGGDLTVIALSQADAPAMLDLVAATEPGPFGSRTPLAGPLSRHPPRRPSGGDGRRTAARAGSCRAQRHLCSSQRRRGQGLRARR